MGGEVIKRDCLAAGGGAKASPAVARDFPCSACKGWPESGGAVPPTGRARKGLAEGGALLGGRTPVLWTYGSFSRARVSYASAYVNMRTCVDAHRRDRYASSGDAVTSQTNRRPML